MNPTKINYILSQDNLKKLKNIAFHEAGHAAAIYLNNKARNLPPILFQIILKDIRAKDENLSATREIDNDCIASIEGGRLIHSFPSEIDLTDSYITAFEADIVNLLVGPLAESKYVHECDDEVFSARLVNISALNNYCGRDDLALANTYLRSLYPNQQQHNEKLHQLFITAFNFVNDHNNWQAILRLANYIHECNKNIIGYDEVISILEPMEAHNYSTPKIDPETD